jgi:hypothetical protein
MIFRFKTAEHRRAPSFLNNRLRQLLYPEVGELPMRYPLPLGVPPERGCTRHTIPGRVGWCEGLCHNPPVEQGK